MVENNNNEEIVENNTYEQEKNSTKDTQEGKKMKRKCILSAEVQEILKEEKVDFQKLVEAVRNDKMDFNLAEHEEDDSYSDLMYEDHPDEYWDDEIKDITEEDVEQRNPTKFICSNSN